MNTTIHKVVLSLLHDCLHKGYCVTLDNYYTSPELTDALLSCDTNSYGTLRKKLGLPSQFWEQFKGEVGAIRWNDAPKKKFDKFVSMLSTINTFEMVNSNKIYRSTGAVIKKSDVIMDYSVTMSGVDLVSWVMIPYSSLRREVKWYKKIAELHLDISVYNIYIL